MYKAIRVLHVFGRLDRGGAETMIMNLYRKINLEKVQFDFVIHTTDKCEYSDEIESMGGRIYNFPTYKVYNHIHYVKKWKEFFEKKPEYKIIHGHMRSTASIYLFVAKKFGLTTIAHSHSISSGIGISAIVKNFLQYPIRYIANYFFACSKSAGIWLFGKKTCKRDNFIILNNAIDTKKFKFNKEMRAKLREKYNIKNKIVIGHVGRFVAAKNHTFLIDVFKEINKKNKDTLLMLVGDGELRESIEKKVSKLGLTNSVIFTGVISDIPGILQAFDIFIFPSLYEGLGLAVIEAQASGLPCIVADTIPKDAHITKGISVLSLNDSISVWGEEVLNYSNSNRNISLSPIKSSGYDIESTSEFLQDFYLHI